MSRRFEAEQIKKGLWDANGPLHPTKKAARYDTGHQGLLGNISGSDGPPPDDDQQAGVRVNITR